MTATCPLHQVEMQEKEGQYGPFYSHIVEGQGYCNGKKINPFKGPQTPAKPSEPQRPLASPPAKKTEEWTDAEKSKQITRLTLAKTFIHQGVDFDNAVVNMDLKKWVDWVYTGEIPTIINPKALKTNTKAKIDDEPLDIDYSEIDDE